MVSRDAIAVIVNPENPVRRLTLQQISDIYSGKINNWSEVGGDNRPIVRLSRETNSGTHVYFLETVLRLGDPKNKTLFSTDTLLLPSSEGIINEVRQNPNAIGYDGLGYIPPDLANSVIAVAQDASGPYVIPTIETVNDNSYPVARDLYMYTAGEPTGAIKDYLDWILSPEAQQIVAELGFRADQVSPHGLSSLETLWINPVTGVKPSSPRSSKPAAIRPSFLSSLFSSSSCAKVFRPWLKSNSATCSPPAGTRSKTISASCR